MSLLGLVYVPHDDFAAECKSYVERLAVGADPKSILRPDAVAHISIAHVYDIDDRAAAWEQSMEALPGTLHVNMANLYFGYSNTSYNGDGSHSPCVDAGIAVVNQPDIADVHKKCLDLEWVQRGRRRSSDVARFFPHLTLGVFGRVPTNVDLEDSILGRIGVECRLVMGPIGEHGVLERIDYIAGGRQ